MVNSKFAGDKKVGGNIIYDHEIGFTNKLLSKFPQWIETYHLTLLTIVWSILIILFSYLAKGNINWLWLVSLMIIMQYITDLFDGKLGKYRNTGLVKWGYYMDHFLDFIFLSSIIIGYSFILSVNNFYLFSLLTISGAFLVNSFLSFSVTNKFKIHFFKIGPTEGRAIFIVINTLIIFLGVSFLEISLPYIILILLLILIAVVFNTQRKIWKIDINNKKSKD